MRNSKTDYPIDIVLPWVDSTDPAWIQNRNEYAAMENVPSVIDNGDARFREWDTLRFLFRSIDQYLPWVRTVHFITCGHLPSWLNPDAKRLHIVNHKDYIPEEYLPTFSSHTIELNMHRIKGLSEHFIYFNDDILILDKMNREEFFRHGLPRDYAIMCPLISGHRFSVTDTALTDIEIINDHFSKNKVIRNNPAKWFNPIYGAYNFESLLMMPWNKYSHLYGRHLCNSFLRKTFQEVWDCEYEILNTTSLHKFRTRRDVNQWLMREWQLVNGDFDPVSPKRGLYFYLKNDNSKLFHALRMRSAKIICVNDNDAELIENIEKCRKELLDVMKELYPEKSAFEKPDPMEE